MKGKRKLIGVVFLFLGIVSLTSCKEKEEAHTHTYGTEWKTSEEGHQQKCEGCGEYCQLGTHIFDLHYDPVPTCTTGGIKHEVCRVCGYEKTEEVSAHGHKLKDPVIIDPTHTQEGSSTKYCEYFDVCGYKEVTVLPKLTDHNYNQEVANADTLKSAATCEHKAVYYKTCICGEKGTDTFEYGELADHTYGEYTSNSDATCTADGTKSRTCSVCNHVDTVADTGSKLAHTFDKEVATATYKATDATCTEPATYYYSCICGEKGTTTFSHGEAAGHTYSDVWSHDATNHWHAANCEHNTLTKDVAAHTWELDTEHSTAATHMEFGNNHYVCSVCGEAKDEEAAKLTEHTYNQEVVADKYLKTAATCSEHAVYYKYCECGEIGTDTFIDTDGALAPHNYNQTVVSQDHFAEAANCDHKDLYYKSCTCGANGTETFVDEDSSLASHSYSSEWTTNNTHHWHAASCSHTEEKSDYEEHSFTIESTDHLASAATCTAKATYYYACKCGAVGTTTFEYGEKLSHTFNQETVDEKYLKTAATCTEHAIYYKSCSCGEIGTDTFIDTTGSLAAHTYGDYTSNNNATCTANGTKSRTCSVCNHVDTVTDVGSKLAHSYEEGNYKYTLVKDANTLKSGDKVIFVLKHNEKYYTISKASGTISSEKISGIEVLLTGNNINISTDYEIFTLGDYAKSSSGDTRFSLIDSNGNYLASQNSAEAFRLTSSCSAFYNSFDFFINENSLSDIKSNGSNTNKYLVGEAIAVLDGDTITGYNYDFFFTSSTNKNDYISCYIYKYTDLELIVERGASYYYCDNCKKYYDLSGNEVTKAYRYCLTNDYNFVYGDKIIFTNSDYTIALGEGSNGKDNTSITVEDSIIKGSSDCQIFTISHPRDGNDFNTFTLFRDNSYYLYTKASTTNTLAYSNTTSNSQSSTFDFSTVVEDNNNVLTICSHNTGSGKNPYLRFSSIAADSDPIFHFGTEAATTNEICIFVRTCILTQVSAD